MLLAVLTAAVFLVVLGTAIYFRKTQRDREKSEMRISVAELKKRVVRREPLVIVDLRHPLDVLAAPQVIPGAIPVKPDEIDSRIAEFSPDEDIVLYCTCPNEETSSWFIADCTSAVCETSRS